MDEPVITSTETEFLNQVKNAISERKTLSEILDDVFPALKDIIPCNRFDIGMVGENGRRMEIRHVRADYEPLIITAGYTSDVPGRLLQRINQEQYLIIENLDDHREEFENGDFYEHLMSEGVKSIVVIPLISGVIIGMLACSSRQAGSLTEIHASMLKKLSDHLRFSFEQDYQADQIEKNYKAYMEMLSFVSHELISPISSIITLVRTLYEGYYGKMDAPQRDIIARIIKKAEYLETMSSQYMNLSRFESNLMELQPQLVDFIDDIINPILEILAPQIEERAIMLEHDYRDTIFPVRCDSSMLKIVMMNLLSNGIKYGNKGGILRISLKKEYKKFSITVSNEGPGFPEHEKHRLFKKFSRLQVKDLVERKGSGIGLYISWKIVQLHGGRIHAESEEGAWTSFIVELPQYMDLCIME